MTLALAAVLDTPAASILRQELRHMVEQGRPLILDGDAVERIGLACLQVLAAGEAAARQAGLDFRIGQPSPALVEMTAIAGLDTLLAA